MIEIPHRYTNATLYTSATAEDIPSSAVEAVKAGANLGGANLYEKTVMPGGETWKQYLEEVVPALLTAGRKSLEEILTTKQWECHDWANCPMAAAYGISEVSEGPRLLQPRIREFIHFLDAGLIPLPEATHASAKG
jgi:hypothetical protein